MSSTRDKKVKITRSITLLLWQQALFSWGIPSFLVVMIGTVVLLAAFNQVSQTTGITCLGWLLLLLIVFFPLRTALTGTVQPIRKFLTLVFGFAWVTITWANLYLAVNVGREQFTGTVPADKDGIVVSLSDQGTAYDMVVQGRFVSEVAKVGHEAGYHLSLEKDGQTIQRFHGTFSEQWFRRRIGRARFTRPELHNRVLHRLRNLREGMYRLKIIRIDSQLKPTLKITFYRDDYPEKTFLVLGALLLIGAYIVHILHTEKKFVLVQVTASALAFVLALRYLNAPPYGYHDLVPSLMIAVLASPLAGGAFCYVADFVARRIGLSPRKPASPRE